MVRDLAKKNAAFAQLANVYENREHSLLEWKKQGGKVVGEFGADVPEELIIAAGMLPIRCYATPDKELNLANIYLEQAFEPCARASFEKMIDGTYADLFDYLAVSHTSDTELRIWLYLREIHRSEPEIQLPPVEFIDWLLVRRRMYQEENRNVIGRFKTSVEAWAGRDISDEDIKAAAAVLNEDHAALRELMELRHADDVRITGAEALIAIGSSFFMDRVEHASLVRELAEAARTWPTVEGKRVFVTGTPLESTDLYDLIEANGAVVVGEDHDWGERSFDKDTRTDIDPIRAVVSRYMLRQPACRRQSIADRVQALDEAAASASANGVIFFMHAHDEAGSWDYPKQKARLEERGVATRAFFRQEWPLSKNEELDADIKSFIDGMEVRA